MKTFKQLFEETYGEGSFNDDFVIPATSIPGLLEKYTDECIDTIKAQENPTLEKVYLVISNGKRLR